MVVTVKVKVFTANGVQMTEVIGLVGKGKNPIATIPMATFPTGMMTPTEVIAKWSQLHIDTKFVLA